MIYTNLIELLQEILESDDDNEKQKKLLVFQDYVFNESSIDDDKLNSILGLLAYDMDYYEPNEHERKIEPSYFDSERLDEILRDGIRVLQEMKDGNENAKLMY